MRIFVIFVLAIGCTFSSCSKSDIPDDLLPTGKMSIILRDLHLAEAFVNSNMQYNDSSKYVYKKMEDSILIVHGTTTLVFDSSLAYYQRHIKLLDEIYSVTIDSLSLQESFNNPTKE